MTIQILGRKPMSRQIVVDTNILIYSIDADSKFHNKSLEVLLNPENELYTTSKNISEFLVVLTRAQSIKIDVIQALDILSELLSNINVLYPNKQTYLIFQEMLKKYKPSGLRIHDFEIISIALAYGINHIATQNISDFKNIKEIKIVN